MFTHTCYTRSHVYGLYRSCFLAFLLSCCLAFLPSCLLASFSCTFKFAMTPAKNWRIRVTTVRTSARRATRWGRAKTTAQLKLSTNDATRIALKYESVYQWSTARGVDGVRRGRCEWLVGWWCWRASTSEGVRECEVNVHAAASQHTHSEHSQSARVRSRLVLQKGVRARTIAT